LKLFLIGNFDNDYTSAAYVATEALCFYFVRPGFCPVTSAFLSLPNIVEWILMKFVGGNYHQQIK